MLELARQAAKHWFGYIKIFEVEENVYTAIYNTALQDGKLPLHLASAHGHAGAVSVLLEGKADVNAICKVNQGCQLRECASDQDVSVTVGP